MKAEHRKIDASELWCWRRLLRVPWTARRSNQSILKEMSPEYSLERLMLRLKLQILWPLDVKRWLIWKDPDAGKDWRQEEKGTTEDEIVGWLNGHWAWVSSRSWWWTRRPIVLQSMRSQRVGHDWATELNQKEQTTNKYNNQDEPLENYDRKRPVLKVIHCMFPFFFFPGWAACWMQDLNSLTRDQTCAALKWKHGVLTTELPENSLYSILEMRKLQDWRR